MPPGHVQVALNTNMGYFFDHTPGAALSANYAPGDGVTYTGDWQHQTGMTYVYDGTLSTSVAGCNTACQGFSGVQGANNFSYQDSMDRRLAAGRLRMADGGAPAARQHRRRGSRLDRAQGRDDLHPESRDEARHRRHRRRPDHQERPCRRRARYHPGHRHHQSTINLYAPDPNSDSVPVYTRTFNSVGTHTITITALGNPLESGTAISLDGFQASTSAPTVIQNSDPAVHYQGCGWTRQAAPLASGGTIMASSQAGDSVTYTFTGDQVTLVGRLCPACGEVDIYVDGQYATRIDEYGYRGPEGWQAPPSRTAGNSQGPTRSRSSWTAPRTSPRRQMRSTSTHSRSGNHNHQGPRRDLKPASWH